MFPPVPAPFAGSVLQAPAADHRLSQLLDRCFGSLALFTGACAGSEAALFEHATWQTSLAAGCLAMVPPVVLGFWAIGRAGALSTLSVTRLYDRVAQSLRASTGGQAIPAARETPLDSFAGLVSATVRQLNRSRVAHARTRQAAQAANAALQTTRDEAGRLAIDLRQDGAAMADAASGIMASSARLADAAAEARCGAACTEDAVAKVAEQAAGLAGSTRQVTGQITLMARIAINAAEAVHGAQAHLAGMDTKARGLEAAASQVSRALQMAGACGREAGSQVETGATMGADLAANLREMASCADLALTNMLAVVTGLMAETAAANRRIADLSALLQSQHELGDAIGQTVGQQGEEITEMLGLVQEAHSGFAAVQAGVDAISRRNNAQLADAEALRGSISRLPARADTIAGILRGIPDFTPPLAY